MQKNGRKKGAVKRANAGLKAADAYLP